MPALIRHGFVDGGGAALNAIAAGLAGEEPPGPARAVVCAGLSAPFARFAADCGLTLVQAEAAIAEASGANGLDVRTGRPVVMAEAGIIDSAAVVTGAVAVAVAATREFPPSDPPGVDWRKLTTWEGTRPGRFE